ncbi:unnamed protein product [Absidia cylindrospora]
MTRLRSQSSPNIHPSPEDPLPPLPTHSYHLSHTQHQHQYQHPGIVKFGKRKSNDDQKMSKCLPILDTTASATTSYNHAEPPHHHHYRPNPQPQHDTSKSPPPGATIKVKVYHTSNIYALFLPLTIDYMELVDRIERKMKCDNSITNMNDLIVAGLKYQDEDGDLTLLRCNDDLQIALEIHGSKCSLNLYIS